MITIIGIDQLYEHLNEWLQRKDDTVLAKVRHAVSDTTKEVEQHVKDKLSNTTLNIHKPMKEGGTLFQGINKYMYKKETIPNVSVGVVNILGDTKNNDGTWRLRFFEAGTKPRVSATGKNLGQIKPKWFFRDATTDVDLILKRNTEKALTEAAKENNN